MVMVPYLLAPFEFFGVLRIVTLDSWNIYVPITYYKMPLFRSFQYPCYNIIHGKKAIFRWSKIIGPIR